MDLFPPPCAIHENVPCLLLKPCRSTPPVNEMYKHDNIYMATFRCQVLYDAIDDVWHCIWFCYRCEDESIGGWVGFVSFFCPTFVWCGRICGTACCVGKRKEKRKQRRSVVCTTMGDRVGGGGEGAFSDNSLPWFFSLPKRRGGGNRLKPIWNPGIGAGTVPNEVPGTMQQPRLRQLWWRFTPPSFFFFPKERESLRSTRTCVPGCLEARSQSCSWSMFVRMCSKFRGISGWSVVCG